MKQLVCLSHEPWSKNPGRTQHLLSRLKDVQILWFQPAAGPLDRRWRAGGQKVRQWVTVYTLPPARSMRQLFHPEAAFDAQRQGRFVAEKMRRHRFRNAALWCTDPRQVHLLEQLEYSRLIYDCHRDWSSLPIEWESQMTVQADVVFAASRALAEYLSPCNLNVVLLPEGVNYAMFAQEFPPAERPGFCFVGSLYPDLDLAPLLYAARELPKCRFTVIGGVKDGGPPELDALKKLRNVRLLGQRPELDLPELLGQQQVYVNLLRDSEASTAIIPERMYEYLATGKPIVSMLWPEQVEELADVIYGAHDEREFLSCCKQALAESPGWVTDRRRSYAERSSWSERAAAVQKILDTLSG